MDLPVVAQRAVTVQVHRAIEGGGVENLTGEHRAAAAGPVASILDGRPGIDRDVVGRAAVVDLRGGVHPFVQNQGPKGHHRAHAAIVGTAAELHPAGIAAAADGKGPPRLVDVAHTQRAAVGHRPSLVRRGVQIGGDRVGATGIAADNPAGTDIEFLRRGGRALDHATQRPAACRRAERQSGDRAAGRKLGQIHPSRSEGTENGNVGGRRIGRHHVAAPIGCRRKRRVGVAVPVDECGRGPLREAEADGDGGERAERGADGESRFHGLVFLVDKGAAGSGRAESLT